jgi:hypothetical protein
MLTTNAIYSFLLMPVLRAPIDYVYIQQVKQKTRKAAGYVSYSLWRIPRLCIKAGVSSIFSDIFG